MKNILTTILLALALCSTSALAKEKEAAKPINDKCPLSGKAVDASKTVAVKVEFCCGKCKKKFDSDPSAYLDKAAAGEAGKCIFNGKPAKKESTLTVGFCCGKCPSNFDAAKHLTKVEVAKKKDS